MPRLFFSFLLILMLSISANSQTPSLDSLGLAIIIKEARKLYRQADYSLALEKYATACEVFKEKEQWDDFYNYQIGVIDCHYKLGHANKVLDMVVIEREKLAQKLGNNHGLVGDYYFLEIKANDRFEEGSRIPELAQKALEIMVPTNGNKTGSVYNSLGVYWLLKKDYDQALANHKRGLAFKIKKFGKDSGTVAVSYNNIGNVYDNLGDYLTAIEYFKKSLEVKIKKYGDKHPRVSNTYFNIGNTYANDGNIDKAILFYEKAIAIDRQSEDDPNRKLALRFTNLSEAFRLSDRLDLAIKYSLLSIEHYAKTSLNPIFPAAAFQNTAKVYEAKKEYDKALPFYQKALALLSSHPLEASGLTNPKIEDRFATKRLFLVLSDKMSMLDTWNKEAPELFKQKAALHTGEALIQTLSFIQQDIEVENSKHIFLTDSRWIFEKTLGFCHELFTVTGDPMYKEKALGIYEQSKAFLLRSILKEEQAKDIANIPDSLKQQIIGFKEILNEIAQQINNSQGEVQKTALQTNLFDKNQEYKSLVSELEEKFPPYFQIKNEQANFSSSLIHQAIKNDEAAFAWFMGEEQLFFFQITNAQIDFKKIVKKADFDTLVISFNELLNDNLLASSKGNSKALYLDFCQQAQAIFQQLFPTDISIPLSLVLIPDGVINLIPFEILLTDKSKNESDIDYSTLPYLLKKAAVRYAYSPSLLIRKADTPSSDIDEILAFAPTYFRTSNSALAARSDMASLQFAQKEIKKISTIFTTENRVGSSATKESFKTLAKEYRLLHLAMHAFTDDENPSFSGLVFSADAEDEEEAFLYAYEIANMQLTADLVVLSACNTGSGKQVAGEGPISLSRSFRQAGCPNIVRSLWQADDEATSILMEKFYKNLKAGKGKAEALQLAKLSYLEQSRKNFPHYWATFVLTGDNEPLDFGQSNFLGYFIVFGVLVLAGVYVLRRKRAL
ncbi:MAG: CHAT domain-containing protein/tetratricopeptide (TPR) repeat protein [Saprospiraceae bacterium]|jgi:CHAT domain-containing protein/tetratricopeptide (TPR) repeat protein